MTKLNNYYLLYLNLKHYTMQSKEDLISKRVIQNMESILNNNPEFFWFIKSKTGKIILLSIGNNRETSKKDAIDELLRLAKTKEKLKELNNKETVFLFILRKPTDKEIKAGGVGGKIGFFIECSKIIFKKSKEFNESLSLKTLGEEGRYGYIDKYWFDDKYLKKNNKIKETIPELIIQVIDTGSPAAVRIISDLLLKELPLYLTYT